MENLWATQSIAVAPSPRVAGMHQHMENMHQQMENLWTTQTCHRRMTD